MSYKAINETDLQMYKKVGINQEQLKDINEQAMKRIDEKVASLTFKMCPHDHKQEGQELKLILLGKSGAGKSATGNLILGKEVFKESHQANSCTQVIKEGVADVDGMRIRVIDTPGFFDTDRNHAEIVAEIAKAVERFKDGIHGFLFVFNGQTYRFTQEQQKIFSLLEDGLFGSTFAECCFIVISHARPFISKGLNDYLKGEAHTPFGKTIQSLKNHVIAVENSAEEEYFREEQQKQLVRLIASSKQAVYTYADMAKHDDETAKNVDSSIRHFVPIMEAEIGKILMDKSPKEIEHMSREDKDKLIDHTLEKVMEDVGTATLPEKKLRKAIAKVLDDKMEHPVGTEQNSFQKIASLLLSMIGVVIPEMTKLLIAWKTGKAT